MENSWIRCDEKLPEMKEVSFESFDLVDGEMQDVTTTGKESEFVLVWDGIHVFNAKLIMYSSDEATWWYEVPGVGDGMDLSDVLAWMPIPSLPFLKKIAK